MKHRNSRRIQRRARHIQAEVLSLIGPSGLACRACGAKDSREIVQWRRWDHIAWIVGRIVDPKTQHLDRMGDRWRLRCLWVGLVETDLDCVTYPR